MTSLFRRVLAIALLCALAATACSSSDGEDVAITDSDTSETGDADASADEEVADDTSTDDEGADDASSESETDDEALAVPEDDEAAAEAIAGLDDDQSEPDAPADPATTVQGFVRSRFNIDPDVEAIGCIVAQSTEDPNLEAALQSPAVAVGEVDDTQMRALTVAMNGCVPTLSLADWAIAAIGPQGDVLETGPPCLSERFDDGATGDLTFYNFTALTYQYRLDPDGIDPLVDSLTACAPITSLSDFFASQAEQASGFETLIDRDCLNEALSPTEVSRGFWDTFVTGQNPPVSFITDYTDQCVDTSESVLAEAVPDDFVPWAGTGALASVRPSARAGIYSAPPPMTIDASGSYEAVVTTGGGEVRIRLFADTAPVTVNNFVNLARDGYFDGTVFHRVLDEFMAQGGDPTGTGTGGPGYQFEDEVDGGPALDRAGLLAMANSGPATNGSQFFITFVPTEWLTGNHTVFGEVTSGMEIVNAIERRDPASPTSRGQVIESITIIES